MNIKEIANLMDMTVDGVPVLYKIYKKTWRE
jgi:hypothetical protein